MKALTTFHITFNDSAAGSIKYGLKNKDIDIILFANYLQEGSVFNVIDNNFVERLNWLHKHYHWEADYNAKMFCDAIHKMSNIPDGATVIIWASPNAGEQLGLRFVSLLLANKSLSIFVCNADKNVNQFVAHKGLSISLRHTGECSSAQIKRMIDEHLIDPISNEQIKQLAVEGEQWLKSKSTFRIFENGELLEVDEDRDDELLLQYLEELDDRSEDGYVRAVKIVGHALGMSDYTASDSWFEYRLRALIEEGALIYRGSLENMCLYDVKKG